MIEVQGVSKSYGATKALDGVSFSVDRNRVLGFLGPNGAGKSTAMKIITTFLSPDAGVVKVDGVDVTSDPLAVRTRIGYLPETAPLYDDMRVRDYLEFVARARGLDGADLSRRLEWVYDQTHVRSVLYKNVNELSKGYRQRVGLAQALLHDPEVLIMDEPTAGLDPNQIREFRTHVQQLGKTKTLLISTHILREVDAVADRVLLVHEGRLIYDGTPDDLKENGSLEEPFYRLTDRGRSPAGGAEDGESNPQRREVGA
jgi:ABC-2 type transport system ATP-binding protein